MICPRCGEENREGANFCRRCGAGLEESVVSTMPADVDQGGIPDGASGAEIEALGQSELQSGDEGAEEPSAAALDDLSRYLPEDQPPVVSDDSVIETTEPLEQSAPEAAETRMEVGEPTDQALATEPSESVGSSEKEGQPIVSLVGEEVEQTIETESEAEPEAPTVVAEPEPLQPLPDGTVVDGRYLLVHAVEVREHEILYEARDLQRCWHCGFEGNTAEDDFCAQCGASLDARPATHLLEVRSAADASPSGETVVARHAHEGRTFLVLAAPQAPPLPPRLWQAIRLVPGQRSDPGRVRGLDEDSLLAMTLVPTYESVPAPVLGLFAVADGMGGHEGGEVASRMALQELADQVLRTIVLPELASERLPEAVIMDHLRKATTAANDAVFLARQKSGNDMGTTLTTAFFRDDQLFLAHVGDCRAYRWSPDGLQQLTTDHSLVASMVARGQAQPEEVYTHPHRSVIYRSIGDRPVVEVDTDVISIVPGDRIVICCDGLWEMIRDEGIEDVLLQEADPQNACDLLVQRANAAGGEDNISVIVVEVQAV